MTAEPTTGVVLANGIRVHYKRCGDDGPLLLLLHGWRQTSCCWRHLLRPLADRYVVVAPDLRGTAGRISRLSATTNKLWRKIRPSSSMASATTQRPSSGLTEVLRWPTAGVWINRRRSSALSSSTSCPPVKSYAGSTASSRLGSGLGSFTWSRTRLNGSPAPTSQPTCPTSLKDGRSTGSRRRRIHRRIRLGLFRPGPPSTTTGPLSGLMPNMTMRVTEGS